MSGLEETIRLVSVQVAEGLHPNTAEHMVLLMCNYVTERVEGDDEPGQQTIAMPAEMARGLSEQLAHFADMVGGEHDDGE